MAPFILMAEEAFVQMLRRVNKGILPGKISESPLKAKDLMPINRVGEFFSDFRETYKELYEKSMGKAVPKGKVAVPKELHDRMEEFLRRRRLGEGRAASMTELDRTLATFSKKPGGATQAQIGEKGSWTFQNNGWMPTVGGSLRSPSKREVNVAKEIIQREQRAWEELLSSSGTRAKPLTLEEFDAQEGQNTLLPTLLDLIQPTRYRPRYRLRTK